MEQTSRATGDGGTEITIRLTAQETEMLGADAAHLVSLLCRGLWAIADVRRGAERDAWWPVAMDTATLIRQLGGVRDVAVRRSPDASHAEVGRWLGESRTTIASRRQKGTLPPRAEPTEWEHWALTGEYPPLP